MGALTAETRARAALITSGSSGIGLAIARALARRGFALTICGRDEERLDAAAVELLGLDCHVNAVSADLLDEGEVKRCVRVHRELLGRMDLLANNAGVAVRQPSARIETGALDRQLALNLRATILMTREALPLLCEAGAEHAKALVVNTSSDVGKSGAATLGAYSAAKFGVIGGQAVHREVASLGVQVTGLCPSYVDTPMTQHLHATIPPETMLRPADVAAVVGMLLDTSPACHIPEVVLMRPRDLVGSDQ